MEKLIYFKHATLKVYGRSAESPRVFDDFFYFRWPNKNEFSCDCPWTISHWFAHGSIHWLILSVLFSFSSKISYIISSPRLCLKACYVLQELLWSPKGGLEKVKCQESYQGPTSSKEENFQQVLLDKMTVSKEILVESDLSQAPCSGGA